MSASSAIFLFGEFRLDRRRGGGISVSVSQTARATAWRVTGVVTFALFMDYLIFGLVVPLTLYSPAKVTEEEQFALLYGAYQERLVRHQLFDLEGRFWYARELLRRGRRRPFEHVRAVFLDGFTDFTRTEHEMLELLASRVDSLTITLPLDDTTARGELFAKPAKTLDQLRRRHRRLDVEPLPRRASGWARSWPPCWPSGRPTRWSSRTCRTW